MSEQVQSSEEQLLRFAGQALCDARLEEIGDWDGGEIQDALAACGLIVCERRTVPCGEDCRCAEYCDRGETTDCYPITPLGQEAVRAYRAWQDAARLAALESSLAVERERVAELQSRSGVDALDADDSRVQPRAPSRRDRCQRCEHVRDYHGEDAGMRGCGMIACTCSAFQEG